MIDVLPQPAKFGTIFLERPVQRMSERRKYDVEQYGGFLCWGVFHGFPIVSWVNCLNLRSFR